MVARPTGGARFGDAARRPLAILADEHRPRTGWRTRSADARTVRLTFIGAGPTPRYACGTGGGGDRAHDAGGGYRSGARRRRARAAPLDVALLGVARPTD